MFGPRKNAAVHATAHSLARGQVPHERFSGREANRRYPHQLKLPEDYECVFEEGGGILYSQRAVQTFQVCMNTSLSPCTLISLSVFLILQMSAFSLSVFLVACVQ